MNGKKTHIVVAGSGRSGAVGLGNIIAGDDCRTLFEPFDQREVPELVGLGLRPYFRPMSAYQQWKEPIKRILAGQLRNDWIDKDLSLFDVTKDTGKVVIKEIRANGILGWLDQNFQCQIVYLLRHPCAVIASRMKLGWETHIDMLLNQHELMEDYLTPFEDVIRSASTNAQKHAVMWCAENLIPLSQMNDHAWELCWYERLLTEPEAECQRLVDLFGLDFSESRRSAMFEFCHKPSTGERRQVARWKQTLSVQDQDEIQAIVHAFGINLYDVASEIGQRRYLKCSSANAWEMRRAKTSPESAVGDKGMNPVVSVVMSVFNGERFLREAVDSILNQTFTDFEFIIVNDGSTDGTREILESYEDQRVVLIHQENMGLTKSLNRGIERASGTYIARQDADDRSFPERLAAQFAFLSAHKDVVLVGSAVEVVSGSGNTLATFRHPTEPDEIRLTLRKYNCFWHGSVMFRRDGFLALGAYSEQFVTAQDYDLWLRFSEQYRLANLPDPFYAYRFTTDSITVRKMVSQHRLADLARWRADAREKGFSATSDPHKVAAFLSAPLTTHEKKQIISNYKPWCRLLLKNDLLDEATQLMTELFRYHPSLLFRLAFRITRHINPQSNLARFLEHA